MEPGWPGNGSPAWLTESEVTGGDRVPVQRSGHDPLEQLGPVVGFDQFVAQGLQGEGVPGAQQLARLMQRRGPDAAAGQDQLGAHPFGIGLIGVGGRPGSAVGLNRRRSDLAVHGGGQPRRQAWPGMPRHGLVSTAAAEPAQSISGQPEPAIRPAEC